jgi:hypothetical protein
VFDGADGCGGFAADIFEGSDDGVVAHFLGWDFTEWGFRFTGRGFCCTGRPDSCMARSANSETGAPLTKRQ